MQWDTLKAVLKKTQRLNGPSQAISRQIQALQSKSKIWKAAGCSRNSARNRRAAETEVYELLPPGSHEANGGTNHHAFRQGKGWLGNERDQQTRERKRLLLEDKAQAEQAEPEQAEEQLLKHSLAL